MTEIDYRVIDADGHYFEADDCCTRYIEPKFREDAVHLVPTDKPGISEWHFRGQPVKYDPRNGGDTCSEPGSMEELFAGKTDVIKERAVYRPKDVPATVSREPRLELLDKQGIEAQIMCPTMLLAWHETLGQEPSTIPALRANYTAFNRWLEDEWGFGADRRNFAAPIVDLCDPDWAAEETLRVVGRGSKFVHLKTGPVMGKSPADPVFDRFWAVVQETGVRVIFHVGHSDFNKIYASHWSEDPNRNVWEFSYLQNYYTHMQRPILDTMAALVLHNLFGRFPGVQVMTVEWGSEWVGPLMKLTEKAVKFGAQGFQLGGQLKDSPTDMIRNHLMVAPYYEDDFRDAIDLLGVDRVLFGSDWPHPEGLREPLSMLKYLEDDNLTDDELRKVMRNNAAKLLGLELVGAA